MRSVANGIRRTAQRLCEGHFSSSRTAKCFSDYIDSCVKRIYLSPVLEERVDRGLHGQHTWTKHPAQGLIQLRDFSMQSDSDDNRVSEMQDALASQHVTNYQSTGIKAVTEGAPKDK
ncbi:uncharacterized protein TNCV_848301 [Trichonephila clavipes]|uniref:Uncharacterized protein n=1 Tax=Trichonephila clavipes TaxID=2585209 RepID=A0A8X6RMD8_TRICX|nr:uncharacterized protein TNCV_848301 [Trichonephila clavipes]